MTRETKIGLLVGLAFLLVVGILLSEHITSATERPAAPLAEAGHGVNRGVAAPGVDAVAKAPEPQQPVPSPGDLTPKPPVSQVAVVVPPQPQQAAQMPTVIVTGQQTAPVVVPPQPVPAVVPQPQQLAQNTAPQPLSPEPMTVRAPTDPFENDPIAKVARAMGQVIVPVSDKPVQGNTTKTTTPATPTVVATNATPAKEYKAQAGDTLSRLASRVPGGNTKTNRDAIVALNPTLQKNPNRVLSGHTYLLPTQAVAVATPVKPEATPTNAKSPSKDAPKTVVAAKDAPKEPAKEAVADATRVYVVKAGDTLSKIAMAELGTKNELPTLRKMNADILKGSDVIKVDMKLKLPAKSALASASVR
ncbi:MAG: LysM domain-containing protein [Tepidisphaeraceae bacterium]